MDPMANDGYDAIWPIQIDTPCAVTSPLISMFGGIGLAFDCEKQRGHDGPHGRVITWVTGDVTVGRLDMSWEP